MKIPVTKHEDDRRVLSEWIKDSPISTCKVIEVKKDSELGNHYHRYKVDNFFLLKGSGTYTIGASTGKLIEGSAYRADRRVPHTFYLKKGSILLEASSTPYDKEDEISILE